MSGAARFGLQILVVVVALAVWEGVHQLGIGRAVVVQRPIAVGEAFLTLVESGTLHGNVIATLKPTITALALAVVVGVPIGLALGLLPTLERVVSPYVSALNAMPRVALAPVFIIVFGIGESAKVALAFSIVVFIMILNARAGVSAADPESVRYLVTLGATKTQIIRKIMLPAAVPSIVSGIRLGLIYALLGVVTSELIASSDGLGQLIASAAGRFDLATVYAILAVLMVAAGVLNSVTEVVERRLLRWQPPMAR